MLLRELGNLIAKQQEARNRPPTNEQLAKIWPPWNALPPDMQPEEKRWILIDANSRDSRLRRSLEALRESFPFLPLDADEFHQTLEQAVQWSSLIQFARSTSLLHQELIGRQWAFAEADAQAYGRIAIHRAVEEIRVTRPHVLDSFSPTLSQIRALRSRYSAYIHSRKQSLDRLSKLLYKIPGLRTGTTLPIEERAGGVPHPPDDVPRYLYIARLDSLGICSPARLLEFLQNELPHLARPKRLRFESLRRKPKYGKAPYAGFLVWVLDNRPVFEHREFGWQWKDILREAEAKGIECPKTCLKQWAHRNGVRLRVKLGQPSVDSRGVLRSVHLLSPAPVFGDVLKALSG